MRNVDGIVGALGFHIGQAEQGQRHAAVRAVIFPVSFDGGDLGRLVLESVDAMHVAEKCLQRRDDQQHAERHAEHRPDMAAVAAAQQMPGAGGRYHQRGGDKGRDAHVCQAERKRGIEDHRQPIGGHYAAIDDGVTGRCMHPAVRREYPGGRHQCAEGNHDAGKYVQAGSDAIPAEQHHAQKARFQEKRSQHFIGQQRTGDAAGEIGEKTPVGAKLVGHDQAGDHSHAEID